MKHLVFAAVCSFTMASVPVLAEGNRCAGDNKSCQGNPGTVTNHVPESIRILRRQIGNKQRQLERLHSRERITEKEYAFLKDKLGVYASHVEKATEDNQLTREERRALAKELKDYNMDLAEARHGKPTEEADFDEEHEVHHGRHHQQNHHHQNGHHGEQNQQNQPNQQNQQQQKGGAGTAL